MDKGDRAGLTLVAPLRGWSTPLEEAPDPVFAGRMLGDGVAIDPTGNILHAPCDATVLNAPASRHALTLRADNGAELLLHIGIDTVGLAGAGFELHVGEGARVRQGQPLITFDLDLLAQRARSVLTPLIITNGERFTLQPLVINRSIDVGEPWIEVRAGGAAGTHSADLPAPTMASGAAGHRREVLVALEHGIHARPAGLIAKAIKSLSADVELLLGARRANARSPLGLMGLGVQHGSTVVIEARGPDAVTAMDGVETLLRSRQVAPEAARPVHQAAQPVAVRDPTPVSGAQDASRIRGVIASRGLVAGQAYLLHQARAEVPETGGAPTQEFAKLDRALLVVRQELEAAAGARDAGAAANRADGVSQGGRAARVGPIATSSVHQSQAAREIAAAHLELLDDPQLVTQAQQLIASGKSAAYAWRSALSTCMEFLRALGDERIAEREADLRDLESRLLGVLLGAKESAPELPQDAILIAEELLPSQMSALDAGRLAGVCLAAGGATSHVAIIAAAMSVPMLVAAGPRVLQIAAGSRVVLDAENGYLETRPGNERLAEVGRQIEQQRAQRAREQAGAQREGRTADGVRIEVFANIGSVEEARVAVANGAEGCGLLRTEFLFLDRQTPPDEAEQTAEYQRIAAVLAPRPVVIRTMDIGGDKPIAYLPLPPEENPALGLRGVRTSLWNPELLRQQLRALLRVRPPGLCRIMLPMVSEPGEIRTVREMLDRLRLEEGLAEPVQLGAMIETPAAAVMADWMAREADFLSVGTNDLTQYVLAMDRGHPELAARLDGLHPAVLRLLADTLKAAGKHDCPVAICGGLASDPVAVPVLIGLGVHELSVVPGAIAQLKALIAALDSRACQALAALAVQQETAEAVRALSQRSTAQAAKTALSVEVPQ
jgi:multiphosphoryl transfer protein